MRPALHAGAQVPTSVHRVTHRTPSSGYYPTTVATVIMVIMLPARLVSVSNNDKLEFIH